MNVMKLIFAVLYVSLNDGCYKTVVFTFIFAVFQPESIAEILLLPLLENKRIPYGNSTSGFDFELFIVISTDITNFI